MTKIYSEMFLTDQWIRNNKPRGLVPDTVLVYEPIFEKHGYTTDDYLRSVEYYMHDPERFARILRNTYRLLDKESHLVQRQISERDHMEQYHQITYGPPVDSLLMTFSKDSFYIGRPVVVADSMGRFFLKPHPADTLNIPE